MLKRLSSRHSSFDILLSPPKTSHAEAAHECTETVLNNKGNPDVIRIKCELIRKRFFDQYNPLINGKSNKTN